MNEPIVFGIVGSGWRAEFFLRIAQARPDLFRVSGIVGRDYAKAAALAGRFATTAYANWQALLQARKPLFVVTSLPWEAAPVIMRELVTAGLPVLSETPPAPSTEALNALYTALGSSAPVQVAEQYAFQPHHAARLSFLYGGAIGPISHAQVSSAHGYHGINLLRRYLGVGLNAVTITAKRFNSTVISGASRSGPPTGEVFKRVDQDLAWFDFGDALGVFDFTGEQYFSYIRDPRVLVRGERGELFNDGAVYLRDATTPLRVAFTRHEGGAHGNLEGKHLKGIQAGERWLYRNVLAPAALSDDEIAIGTCLLLMADFVRGGQPFYGLAEACHDTYLSFLLNEALAQQGGSGVVRSSPQAWQV
jgi:predicted dehydrogenase